jgi:hypothetical protein
VEGDEDVDEGINLCSDVRLICTFLLLVSAPTNWCKGKFLGSGAFGQVCQLCVHAVS